MFSHCSGAVVLTDLFDFRVVHTRGNLLVISVKVNKTAWVSRIWMSLGAESPGIPGP